MTGSALSFPATCDKVERALVETRIRGVKTNIPFIVNVLRHPQFKVVLIVTISMLINTLHK